MKRKLGFFLEKKSRGLEKEKRSIERIERQQVRERGS
jgi:hypothetical protein